MNRFLALAIILAAAVALFYHSAATPSRLPVSAPATAFSAGRAMLDDAALAPIAHPVGSPANRAVRDRLIVRMTALGLSPRIVRAKSRATREIGDETWIAGADVEDIVGLLPGHNPNAPALLLMAHYDSVAGSPGAADDIAGISSILEIVRALRVRGVPERDVVVAFTDGEEAGLLGARAFFRLDPLAPRVGFVVNLEARGGGGRAAMFETGARNGQIIDLYRRTAAMPNSTSLSVFVYQLLPNDTDFSVAKARGLSGLNYAFIGRQFDYHSPSSTIAALDQGSVQHMGQQVLGTAAAIAFSDHLPRPASDKVYADLFGLIVIAYPAWGGWLALALAGGLMAVAALRAAGRGLLDWSGIGRGVVAALAMLIMAAVALAAVRYLTGAGFGFLPQRPLLARFPLFEAASAAAGLATILFAAGLVAGRDRRLAGTWTGLLLTALVVGAVLQATVGLIAFVVAWPLIAAAFAAAVSGLERPRSPLAWVLAGGAAILATAWLLGLGHDLLQGLDLPGGPAPVVLLAALALWPMTWPGKHRQGGIVAGAIVLAASLAVALSLRLSSPWTARHPEAVEPLYVLNNAAGRAWRVDAAAPSAGPGAWSRSVLTAEGGRVGRLLLPDAPMPIAAAAARYVAAADPRVEITRAPNGTVTMVIHPAAGMRRLRLDLRCDTLVTDARIDGAPEPVLAHPGRWTRLRWEAAPEGLAITFRPVGPGTLDVQWAQFLQGWPAGETPPPPMPATAMGWDLAGSTVTVGRSRVKI